MLPIQDLIRAQFRLAQFAFDVQTVMTLRLMGMSGILPASRGESNRMVAEKPAAWAAAGMAGWAAAVGGATPQQITDAAMRPLQKEVSRNRRRLTASRRR
jgi:hypothetical protein